MSLLTVASTLDKFLIDNYPEKDNISLDDDEFSTDGKDTWISATYIPVNREIIGTNNRIEDIGLYMIRCYAEYKKPCLGVADTVTSLLDEQYLDNNVFIEVGEVVSCVNLDGNLYEATVNFRVTRS